MDADLTAHLALLLDPVDAERRAAELLRQLPTALRLGLAPTGALVATRVVTEVEARRIRAAFVLASAALAAAPAAPLTTPETVVRSVPELWTSPVEELWVLPVDASLRPLCRELVARGGPASCAVRPTDVLRRVVLSGATGLFLLHNHPSGDASPSGRDRRFTAELGRRATELELLLHDHLVVGGMSWASCTTLATGRIEDMTDRVA